MIFSDKELLEIFPEAKEIIPEKIREWKESRNKLYDTIKKKLKIIKEKSSPKNQWFWRMWVQINEVEELLKVKFHIVRLKRLLSVAKGQENKTGVITEEQIQTALDVPIQNLFNGKFRKVGKTLKGLCPFHKEKSPSFCIYLETNTCWCFGCQQGGNTINSVKLLYGYSFRETISYLIGK